MNAVTLASIIAVLLAVAGVVEIINGNILIGIVLIVAACAVGPGGWTVLKGR